MRTIPTTLAAALAATGALALPASAPAQPTCTYDATTATVQLALDAPAPNGAYTLARSGSRIGWLNGRPDTGASFTACGAATVTNTDTIDVTGTPDADDLVIGLGNRLPLEPGGFAPGRAAETGGVSEIEIGVDLDNPSSIDTVEVNGSRGDDKIGVGVEPVTGQTEIQLTNDVDADLTLARDRSLLVLDGNAGDDTISLRGTGGITLDAYTLGAILRGGPGEDHLFGSDGDDTLTGGPDLDFFDGGAGIDTFNAADGLAGESITTGNGNDVVNGDPGDVIDP